MTPARCKWCGKPPREDDRYCSPNCERADMLDELFHRRRKSYGEKWPRFCAEIPPELATILETAQRKRLGVNYASDTATRANMVRAALHMYLRDSLEPLPEKAVDTTAEEMNLPELPA